MRINLRFIKKKKKKKGREKSLKSGVMFVSLERLKQA